MTPAEHIVATAGHVDHGKSTLVHALTGTDPDRWEQEKQRGLTIDLGYAWTSLPSGRRVAFVDVPGHQRFLGNMLAGLGPAPVVLFVVSADEGWRAQSSDHRDAVAALGIDTGLVVLTHSDRVSSARLRQVRNEVREQLSRTGLRDAPIVATAAPQGLGLDELRRQLDAVLADEPAPDAAARVRLWVDRAFTIRGAGTVVTGSLTAGTIAVDDTVEIAGSPLSRLVSVRGLHSAGTPVEAATPVSRVAVNLRAVDTDHIGRGAALVDPDAWWHTRVVDVRRLSGDDFSRWATDVVLHVGTAAVPIHLRPLGSDHARVQLAHPLPLAVGDRAVLRDAGAGRIGGCVVLDVEPPAIARRGAPTARAHVLAGLSEHGSLIDEVTRRGAVRDDQLRRMGVPTHAGSTHPAPAGLRRVGDWWVSQSRWAVWVRSLRDAVDAAHSADSLAAGLSHAAAAERIGLPDATLLTDLVTDAGLVSVAGVVADPGHRDGLGAAEPAVRELEARLRAQPFAAPEAHDLQGAGLGARELAAAERMGRVLRLRDGVVLLPTAPALAMRELAGLEQPFTTSDARQALHTTRRVAIPLLEHLDQRGWTRRVDATHRTVVR